MQEEYTNIYKKARKNTLYTIEKAAEHLGISDSSLKNYERDINIPSEKVVQAMAKLYNEEYLELQHIWNTSEIFRKLFPKAPEKNLPLNVLYLQKKTLNVKYSLEEMIDIACDGKITDDEKIIWLKIVDELRGWMEATAPLIFIR